MESYTESQKRNAVRAYVVHGSYRKAEEATGIPYSTIAAWKCVDRDWWEATLLEVNVELLEGDEDKASMERVRRKAVLLLEERLDKSGGEKTADLVKIVTAITGAIDVRKSKVLKAEENKVDREAKFKALSEMN